ncbi:MAG: hybrid sensor histidine kinase/response regulator [Moorea sp. SIO2B7]|nr:hybrid sensor histidine kinase/response regulator [Moorena sp. SIO2B7]
MVTQIDTNDQAYKFFVQESLELLQNLEEGLLTLGQQHDTQKIHGLMRAAHSIKGGAACVGLTGISNIAHDLENGFRALYKEDTVFDFELEDLLLQAFDCLRAPINDQINTGEHEEEKALELAKPIFEQLEVKLGHPLEEAAELPEVQMEMDGDITEFLFTEEIPQGLKRWENLLKAPRGVQVIEEMKSQAEVFASLGEMLNLSGFSAIADTTMKALTVNPKLWANIGKLALADFRAGQEAVLSGDRTQGGSPREALLKLTEDSSVQKEEEIAPANQKKGKKSTKELLQTESSQDNHKKSQSPQENVFRTSSVEKSTKEINERDLAEQKIQDSPPTQKKQEAATARQSSLGVRIDINRLNLINNLVGELVTQDNSFFLKNKQNQVTLDAVKKWSKRFNELTGKLQYLSNLIYNNTKKKDTTYSSYFSNLNSLSQMMGEEIAQLGEFITDSDLLNQHQLQIIKQRQQTIKQIENNLLQARMLPIGDLMNRFPRTVRDLSVQGNKPVKLDLVGKNTLVDKAILSKLYDPLVHLVRNAFDHGIGFPEIREAQGKPTEGTITIRAYNRGNYTYIEVEDDGQGIDPEKIRISAINKNLIDKNKAYQLSTNKLYELLFIPGFSTTKKVSQLSGRGVGLDAVRLQVRELKGNVTLTSELGKGTKFTLRLPWTLTITKLLVFQLNNNLFAIPVNTLAAIVRVENKEIKTGRGKQVYLWKGKEVILIQSILSAYNYPSNLIRSQQGKSDTWDTGNTWQLPGKDMLLLVSQGEDTIGLKVDQILMEQNLVIKPFSKVLTSPSYLSGCTILGDGRLVSVLDSPGLIERSLTLSTTEERINREGDQENLPTILVIDDSLTTRQTLSSALQKAGYHVIQAKDGGDGLSKLQQNARIQAVISDVEMPNMNGFEFLSRCRKLHSKESLPVLMLTSRSSERYRQLARQLGSNGYMTKPYIDKEVIDTLKNCLLLRV